MEIKKEISEISWQVPEKVYREDPAISYSTISTYETLGFNGLDHIFDKKESTSLVLGSCVDSIITGGMEEFNNRFSVIDVSITDGGMDVVNQLLSMKLPYAEFDQIPEMVVSNAAKEVGFWKADKWDKKRYGEVLKTGNIGDFYNASYNSDKTMVTTKMYEDVQACVKVLRESTSTANYFAEDDIFSPIKRYYQLKFKAKFDGVTYRNMADELIVDYEHKIVYPVDLKTSSTPEWDFEESFIKWHYYIQAVLYWNIIRANMDADPYFKDFELRNYRFIVVNPRTLTPLVWEFPLTKVVGTFVDDNGTEWRSPFELGKELKQYLDLRPAVPNGIVKDGINVIKCLRSKTDEDLKTKQQND